MAFIARKPGDHCLLLHAVIQSRNSCLAPLSCAAKKSYETAVTDPSVRMATQRAQCADGPLLRPMQLLLLVLLGSSLHTCCMSAAPAPTDSKPVVHSAAEGEEPVTAVPAHATLLEIPHSDRNSSTRSARGSTAPTRMDKEYQENIALLRTAVAAADATQTEKPTNSRYFLGVVSQRIRRHLVVDIISLVLLLAGYYLVATGLTQKAAHKPENRNSKQGP